MWQQYNKNTFLHLCSHPSNNLKGLSVGFVLPLFLHFSCLCVSTHTRLWVCARTQAETQAGSKADRS